MYNDTSNIKKLFHWVQDDRTLKFVLENGIVGDKYGFVYLSERPLNKKRGYTFVVKIPDNNKLIDWREAWYDDEGNQISDEHEYDENNPYYIYLGNIPSNYIHLIK